MIREYLEKDLEEFPDILDWYDRIKDSDDYKIVIEKDFYVILKLSKNKICRLEKLTNKVNLKDILKTVDKYISKPQTVIVPISRKGIMTQFYLNGFDIDKYLKSKYRVGRNCYLMTRR